MQQLARRWQCWHWLASPVGALLILVATACSNGKTPGAGADTSADTGHPFNVDGMVNGDSQADDTSDVDSSGLGDLAYDTAGPLDAPNYDVIANCPGGALCPCSANTDCQSGLCLEDPSAEGGKACAQACKPDCAKGYVCANLTSGTSDIQQFCVYQAARLCDPCSSSKDCEVVGLVDSKCVDQGGTGRFCGVACVQDDDCPADYGCQQVGAVEGGKFKQCVRTPAKGSAAVFGECTCSASAVQKQLSTTCYGEEGAGAAGAKCMGVRTCGTNGLSACNAPSPATETCDGADNDCDGATDEATCDDQLPCTQDVCDGKGSCVYTFVSGPTCDLAKGCTQVSDNGKPCEADNSLCTQGDVCLNGVCKVGAAVQCDDGNPCTVDGCDKKTGQCTAAAVDDGVPCNDGTKCTEKDSCKTGVCKGKAVDCDDGNPCTEDVCDPALGCQISKLSGAPCSDDNLCTVGDLCKDGQCAAGEPKVCTSGDPCVTSLCSPVDGKCKLGSAAKGTPCDDGNACTAGEECDQGVCQGGANSCGCQKDADCTGQEDGNLCNGVLFCDKAALPYVCKVKPNSAIKCDISGDSECLTTACVPTSGACQKVTADEGKGCDADGSVCTVGDACAAGKCLAGKGKNCDDGNVCTDESCDALLGCKTTSNTKPCDDGNACTAGDSCGAGTCSGTPKNPVTDCGDGNPCTNDACDPKTGCTHVANQAQCDDGNPCTVGDVCAVGKCSAGANNCGCQADGDCAAQEDGDLCNGTLLCDKGKLPYVCVVAAKTVVACDLSKDTTCSATVCNGKSGACEKVLATDGKGCDADGSVCTVGDACMAGSCAAGAAADCDDKNACTQDSCDGKKGCVSTAAALGTSCSDGNACTVGDQCGANGQCSPGKAQVCDDNNACTADSCKPLIGCAFVPIEGKLLACYPGPSGQIGVGQCKAGSAACQADGLPAACVGAVVANAKELCDGKDDTCDGKTDEGCAAVQAVVRQSGVLQSAQAGKAGVVLRQQSGLQGQATGKAMKLDWSSLAWWQALVGQP